MTSKPDTKLAAPPAPTPAAKQASDFVVIRGRTADGEGLGVLRCREGRLEVGQVQPLREGKPIHGEVVRLHPHADCPPVCDVEVELPAPASAVRTTGGPAQVANAAYRKNWDAIFRRDTDAEIN